ncbi:MAG: AI-2E family transporter [Clostridia bacterium]|nr:AI-2E family transporter [Clostridia bacterium]
MDLNKKNLKKIFFLCVGVILVYLALQNMNIVFQFLGWIIYVLMPFIIAGCMTFFLNVPLKAIEKRLFRSKDGKPVSTAKEKARRPVAIVLSLAFFILIIGILLIIVIPELSNSIQMLANSVPSALQRLQEWVNDLCKQNETINNFVSGLSIDWNLISTTLMNFLKNDAANFVGSVMNMLTSVVSIVVNVFLGIVLSIYTLMRKEKLSSDFKKLIYSILPMKTCDYIVEVAALTNQSFYNCITGQMAECVILGSLTALGMTIFGFPYAPLVGVLIAILSWIPMFGVGIGIVVGALLILTVSPVQTFWFVIFMICLQQIEGNLIFPRVVGSNIGLPPIFLVSAIVIFSNFFGIIGLLVSGAVTSVLYALLRRFVYTRIKERNIPKEKYEVVNSSAELKSDEKPKNTFFGKFIQLFSGKSKNKNSEEK